MRRPSWWAATLYPFGMSLRRWPQKDNHAVGWWLHVILFHSFTLAQRHTQSPSISAMKSSPFLLATLTIYQEVWRADKSGQMW